MAKATYQAALNADRTATVTRSTDDALGSATAAILFDNTANYDDVREALNAAWRAFEREASKASAPSGMSVTGTSTE